MIILQDHSIFAIELLEFFLIDFYHNIQLKKRENIDYIDLFPQYNDLYNKCNYFFNRK